MMLRKKSAAWIITAVFMVLSLFLGAWGSYGAKRRDAADVFNEIAMPHILQATVPAFNIQTVATRYLSPADMTILNIGGIVDRILHARDPADIFEYYLQLYFALEDAVLLLHNTDMSESNQNFINTYHRNFLDADRILRQSGYNRTAEEFNNALGSNLGFIVRIVVREMPRFDVDIDD